MPSWVPLVCILLSWSDPAPKADNSPAPLAVVEALETALADVIAKAEPSVVAIARIKSDNDTTMAVRGRLSGAQNDPIGGDALSFDYGSGVVIGNKGEILTAFHVVKGAARLHVRAVGHQRFDAEVIAADPRSDLAVIVPRDVPGNSALRLTPIPIGDAGKLRKGMFLIALGNPFNAAGGSPHAGTGQGTSLLGQDGRPSASWGILSNVARRIELSERQQSALRNYPTLLQLDAKLNLGMSGGAVVNLKGELIGITTTSANAEGFDPRAGYAIPMDTIGRRAVELLREGREVEYGFLGISLDTENLSNRVREAQPGTPAAEGEVQAGDEIIAVGDMPVSDMDSLVLAINSVPAGSRVVLKLIRHNQVLERTIELAKLRVEGEVIATNRPPSWRGLRVDYTSILPHVTFGMGMLSAMAVGGVAVTEVENGSPAEKAGLRAGLIVKSVAGKNVRSPRDFAAAVAELKGPAKLVTDMGPVVVK